MIFINLHVCTTYSIGKKRLRPNPRQQNNKNQQFYDWYVFKTIFNRRQAPAANLKGNKNITNMAFHICSQYVLKKAPAAALRHDQNEVHQTSPDFTGLQQTSLDFTGVYRNSPELTGIALNIIESTEFEWNCMNMQSAKPLCNLLMHICPKF